jgi:hypothetical protein
MTIDRRAVMASAAAAAAGAPFSGAAAQTRSTASETPETYRPSLGPGARALFVNDLNGDVDGLFAAAHAVLSPSVELRAIIGIGTGAERKL